MNQPRSSKPLYCVLLLLLFSSGALVGTLYREKTTELLQRIPDTTTGCFAIVLALDASMTGSLLARLTFPLITFIIGAVSAIEASGILSLGLRAARQRLLILAVITPLHFLISMWSLQTAGRLRRSLRAQGHGEQVYIVTFLLTGIAYLACIGLIYLRWQAKI